MRVIAGTRKSLTLKSVPGMGTRPTTDRIKETLFNIISPYLYESRFLDVFAGSGGIGIEALSRGASFCCFIEKEPKAVSVIRENIKKTGFEKESEIIKNNAANIDIFL
ncbi:MAG TPA: RsmD family RNA methyltransferase, partial [Candidatus Alectryocaccobium stercorigallinarum]|nr:RsmD family RNA methyltransferase [Candidatus Alectryocaccobium stercorigallinarum]